MVDRQPTNPGRVRLDPVSGQPNVFDMSMADGATEQGTPLYKATFLKDSTAALYGLPNTAVPDDVFACLGKYAEHCWKRRTVEYEYTIVETPITSNVSLTNSSFTVQYSSSITCDADGIHLVNPSTFYVQNGSYGAEQFATIAPCYFECPEMFSGVYYLPQGTTGGAGTSYTIYYSSSYMRLSGSSNPKASAVTVNETVTKGDWELVFSTNRNAYPDSGVVDGYEYEYVGVPFDKLPIAPQIETGSYVGTGTYGQANPNTLTFDFAPKLIFIKNFVSANPLMFLYPGQTRAGYMLGDTTSNFMTTSWNENGKSVSWYHSTSANFQMNENRTDYFYFAIG